jgi:hypothetical protein
MLGFVKKDCKMTFPTHPHWPTILQASVWSGKQISIEFSSLVVNISYIPANETKQFRKKRMFLINGAL